MRGSTTFWGAVAVFGLATTTSSSVAAHPSSSFQQQRARREVAADAAALSGQTVDYVIVGGGNAGLVIANRLSEDANVTVAVIEAGSSGYESNRFDSPAGTYYNSPGGPQSPYDWNYLTVPQQHMDGNPRTWPRGRVLGGSTGINGMYLIRASQPEHDSWAQLNDASPVWGWDNFLTGMKKSETFTGPDSSVPFQIPYNDQSRGSSGPLHATYPGASYPVVDGFINAMASLGSPLNSDPYNGDNTGSYVGTAAINPSNWTRSFARSAYLDPFAYRQNLRVLAGAHVTKVNFQDDDQTQQGNKRAVSVTYQANANSQAYTLNANREVILTAGAVGTPQVLQLSGVGPKQHLDSVGVDTVIDLPGVGHGVSDHLVTSVSFTPAQGAALPPSRVTTDAKVDSYINTATSYVNLTTLFGSADEASQFITGLRSNLSSIVESYDAPPAVKRGYNATLTETLRLLEQGTAPMEMLFASVFGGVQIQLALQHSLSRGTVLIGSANPFEYPIIDPHYGQQNADIVLLRAAMKLARRAGASQAFQQYAGVETGDTTGATDDNAIDAHIRRAAQTEYHPAGSCAMLPYDQGGVVDQTLLVYNTTNLRVIDGSVPPSPLSTHLMTVVYGMAEIGADIIKAAARGQDYNGISPTRQVRHTNDSSSSSSEGSKGRTGDAASGSGSSSGASAQGISSLTMMASASALVGLVSLL